MDAPDVAAFVVTLEGIIAGWGDGVASLLGYRAEEVIGREVSMFLPGEHPSHFPRILAAAARGQRIETFETMVGRDGVRLQVALRAVPTRNGGGQVTGARATLRDVTPERSEEAQAWMTALLESSHDGLYALDGRGVIRNWSPGAERLYGYAAHEAVGLPYTSLFPDNRHEEAAMALNCALAGEPVSLFDTEARRKDGGLVPSFLSLWPIWDRRGKVAGVSAIAQDVTEEQLVQEALADSQGRLRDTEVMARVGPLGLGRRHRRRPVVGGPAPHLRYRPGALRRHARGAPGGHTSRRPGTGTGRDAPAPCPPPSRLPPGTGCSGPTARRAGSRAEPT